MIAPILPLFLHRYCLGQSRARRVAGIAFALISLTLLMAGTTDARTLKFHGPVIQWHRDPCTTASFSWVEQIAPDGEPLPVWRTGNAGFGYGDDDDVTVLAEMEDHSTRLYLAKTFNVSGIPSDAALKLGIRYDDAFIAYINGREVARSANIRGRHAGADVTDDHEGDTEEVFVIANPRKVLRSGKNLIAIEGHNVRKSSSDLTFQPRLLLNGREIVGLGSEWHYLASGDPPLRWYLSMPKESALPELPNEDESEWTLSIRRRGSGLAFRPIEHEQDEFGSTGNPVFRAVAEGLRPGTAYDYNLSAGSRSVKTGWFTTAPAQLSRNMKFVVGGDMGTAEAIPICRAVAKDDPLFVVVGGDLAYANGRADSLWYSWIDNWTELMVAPDGRSIPIVAAIGNHETKSFSGLKKREILKGLATLRPKKSLAPFYFSFFDLPDNESNFRVDFSNYMSFVVLDSGHSQHESSQTGWLEDQLEDRAGARHLFVTYHEPAWGVGIKKNNDDVQDEWCPLFEEYQVDCVFENDHHCYKRSHPLIQGVRNDQRGILYLGDGAWGAKLRPITSRMLDREGARNYLAAWKSIHHVIRVTLQPNGRRLYQAFDSDRAVFDSTSDSKVRR
ncbi:acid phosphatase [Haloferula helveola]|uniref:Acid phosphatase n=1 Tax=Haloferula helveola TaxID=490095 RepID=A0ABM7RCC0_9BACT|nr:acid phosphatase [Haloferula helveola]